MARRSKFINGRENISKVAQRFEKWLLKNGYSAVSDFYPAVISAESLINEFLTEYPAYEHLEEDLENHAAEIGWISDYDEGLDDEEEPYTPLDPDEVDWS